MKQIKSLNPLLIIISSIALVSCHNNGKKMASFPEELISVYFPYENGDTLIFENNNETVKYTVDVKLISYESESVSYSHKKCPCNYEIYEGSFRGTYTNEATDVTKEICYIISIYNREVLTYDAITSLLYDQNNKTKLRSVLFEQSHKAKVNHFGEHMEIFNFLSENIIISGKDQKIPYFREEDHPVNTEEWRQLYKEMFPEITPPQDDICYEIKKNIGIVQYIDHESRIWKLKQHIKVRK